MRITTTKCVGARQEGACVRLAVMANEEDVATFLRDIERRGWSKSTLTAVSESVIYGENKGPRSFMLGEIRVQQGKLGKLSTKNVKRAMVELTDFMTEVGSEGHTVQEYILGYVPVGDAISESELMEMKKWNGFFKRALHIGSLDHAASQEAGMGGAAGVMRFLLEDVANFMGDRRALQALLQEGRSYHPSELEEIELGAEEPAATL